MKMSRRRTRPVGHNLCLVVVALMAGSWWCCDAAPDANTEATSGLLSSIRNARVTQKYTCSGNERLCRPSQVCLPLRFDCDYDNDCPDGSDESECYHKSTAQPKCDDETFFHCEHSQRCIPKRWVCDGEPDCGSIAEIGFIDRSDEEQNCTVKCKPNEMVCSNGKCLAISKFCDGHVDCSNDENSCAENLCKNLKCDYDCRMTPSGAKCFCPAGQMPENITKCAPLKSCSDDACDQLCSIINGAEQCSCVAGYARIMTKCVATSSSSARIFLLGAQQLTELTLKSDDDKDESSSAIKVNFTAAYDMEINYANNTLCVLERSTITCFNVTNFEESWKLPQPDFLPISDTATSSKLFISNFAIDWISGNFYLVDSKHQIIILCSAKMEHCRTVVSDLGNANIKFQDIAIDPTEGFLFLSKFNTSSSSGTELLRFGMDGSDKLSLFEEKLFYPKDLTLDVAMKRIYFLDNSLEFIQECDYNGKRRRFLQKLPPLKLQRMMFYENTFYALNGSTSALLQIDKSTNTIVQHPVISASKPKLLRIFAEQIQPKLSVNSDVCSANGGCDQLCVPMRVAESPSNNNNIIAAKCLCTEGFELKEGNKCMLKSAKKLLFFIQKHPTALRAIDVENVDEKVIAPIVGLEMESTYEVDIRARRIYFTMLHTETASGASNALPVRTDQIEYRSFDGKERGVLRGEFGSIQSMAYDWIGKNIFFTTGSPRTKIVVIRVDNDEQNRTMGESPTMKTLIARDIAGPSSIALNPDDGLMFWTSFSSEHSIGGRIEMSWMDGTSRSLIASRDTHRDHVIYWPVSLTYHRSLNKLFWLDVLTQRINSMTLGENRIISQIYIETHSQSLTVVGNQILWTDNIKNVLLIADMDNNVNLTRRTTLLKPNEKVFQLRSFLNDDSSSRNVAAVNQKQLDCPGILFTLPANTTVCLCGDGYSKNGLGNVCIKNTPTTQQKKINCSDVQFACKSLDECISRDFVCDGFNDCTDRSDEELAPAGLCPNPCTFKCDDSRCLGKHQVCDGVPDCTDKRDESDETCSVDTPAYEDDYCDEFLCANSQCVPFNQYCDGIDNCGDNSDELDCRNINITALFDEYDDYEEDLKDIKFILEFDSRECRIPELYCEPERKCIGLHQLCDEHRDCSDGSDEGGKCSERVCDGYGGCEHFCQNTPHGASCYCPEHLLLDIDGKSCVSPQICDEFSCSHSCETLSLKKTRCRCTFGYQLKSDNFTCESMDKKEPILVFSSRQIIKGVKLNRKQLEVKNYYQKGRNIIGLDFYYDQMTKDYILYWSDITSDKIYSGVMVNDEIVNPKPIVESHISQVESVAVDWIGKNLYWVDSALKHIDVTTKEGMHRATLISENIAKPRSLAIDSRFAYLFWSDWEEENPRIERATLAGEDRKSIFNISSKAGGWANGITLDFVKQRIFYVDAKTKEIHTINYDGENFKRIVRDPEYLPHPYAVTIFENNLYWSDWRRQGIIRGDKFTGNNIGIFINSTSQLFDVKLIHSSRQPTDFNGEGKSKSISSPCEKSKCSHLCLLSTSTTFKCHCPRMMRLKSNSNETCESINKMIFYINDRTNVIRGLDLDFPNSSSLLTIHDSTKIVSPIIFDIHPVDMRIYWFDESLREMNSMKLATPISPMPENIENILDSEVYSLNTFAIDWTSNLMFFVQREGFSEVDVEFVVFACNTRGELWIKILEDQQEISSLLIAPKRQKLYFVTTNATSLDSQQYLIQEINYDGSELITVFREDETVDSLVIDHPTSTLYFVKNHLKIFSYNLDTKDTRLVNTFYGEGDSKLDFFINRIALFNDDLYFHENTTNSLWRCNKHICHEPTIFRRNLANLRQFSINQFNIASSTTKSDDYSSNNKCYKSNQHSEAGVDNSEKVCQHLCMPKKSTSTGSSDNFICKCAMGYKPDEKLSMTCVPAVDSIIYSHDHEMEAVSVVVDDGITFPPLQHIHTISFSDVDTRRDLIYIADNERGEIYRVKRDGSGRETILLPPEGYSYEHAQYEWFSGLAIDWIAENLYFSDKSKGIIEIVALAGRYRHVLLSQINKPSQINIDPVNGVLFFIDGNNSVLRYNLNSSSSTAVKRVSGDGVIANVINDFVLDIDNRLVYVCESRTNSLWQIDYDGANPKQIKDSLINNWISIDILDGRIYWAERSKREINSVSLSALGDSILPEAEKISVNSQIRKLKVMSLKRQSGSNLCAARKGNCSEICLSDRLNVNCLCTSGTLNDDKRTCKSYANYLYFSSENQFEKVGLDHILEHPKIENSSFIQHAVALTYDFESQIIFYSDIKLSAILSCNFNGNNFTTLIDHQVYVEGLTWNSQDNELFWTLGKDAEIRSKRLNLATNPVNTILKMNSDVDKLRALAVEPCLGMLYFSNWNKKSPSISRIFITGYGKENVITTNIFMPNALTLDLEEKLLFWADAKLDKLERCNYDGRNRVILSQSTPKHPFALTVFKKYIYWSDWILRAVLRTNKFSGNDATFVATNISNQPMGLFVAQPSLKSCTNDVCSGLKSGCEDICLPKGGSSYVCECTQGFLDADGKRCLSRAKAKMACNKTSEFDCKSGECIPYKLTCDGVSHCSDNSDEATIFCATRKCPSENFYQCHDARCIEKSERCDGNKDCKSGEDEEGCDKSQCTVDEFKCKNGDCIMKAFLCDYKPDCLDASDEIDCENRTCSRTLLKAIDGVDLSRLIPCNRTSNCYLKEWECDGQNDCWDWSDERNCNKQTAINGTCLPGYFRCANHECILMQFVCDGVNDCEDLETSTESSTLMVGKTSSDEMNCRSKTCTENQFICEKSKACIPLELVCDGNNDCPDEGETDEICKDEEESITIIPRPTCLSTEQSCLSGECIPKSFFCDGKFDCDDMSDEREVCLIIDEMEIPPTCEPDEFTCRDKTCIKLSKICNLESDCPDNSDENMTLCQSYPAYCKQSMDRYLCSHGGCINASLICNGADDCGDFSDEMSCNINECEFTSCGEHAECRDLKIGMECVCNSGFTSNRDNPMRCDDINECESRPCSQICLNTPGSYSCHCIDGYIREGHRCRANSKDHPKLLFATQYYIKTVDFTGHSEILVHNLTDAVAIDFDWNRKYIYYSDGSRMRRKISRIRVDDKAAGTNTTEPEVLHRDSLKSPDGIAFDFVAMNLYWCDKGQRTIEVSRDNGKYRKVLIKSKLENPRALVLNPFQRFMYWSDWGSAPHIGRAGMDGSSPEVIVSGNLGWPNALTISFETNELFFGDAKEDFISVCDLDGRNRKVVAHQRITPSINHIFAIAVWDERVFFSDWETNTIEYCDKYSGKNCGTLMKFAYRPLDIKIYHPYRQQKLRTNNDTSTKTMKSSQEKKKDKDYKKKVDILTNVKDNLCSTANCSALCLLSPSPPFYQCQCPDYFYLDKDQKSCVANCSAAQFHCKKSMRCIPFFWKCDGQADCESGEDEPSTCAPFFCQPGEFQCDYDKLTKNATCLEPIQVCDGKRQCRDGNDEKNCDVYGCFIESQFQCEKTANSSTYCIPNKARCDGLVDCPSGNDELGCPEKSCSASKFQCESKDTCLPKVWLCDGDRDCIDGSDEKNCKTKECFLNEFRCPTSGRCIPYSWLCDSEKDCPDGSDEGEKASCDVMPKSNSCDPTYFKCKSGKCIPGRYKCDKVSDCDDGSDELECPHLMCAAGTEFRCSNGQCIDASLKCNGHFDCDDFSDEQECESTDEGQCLNPSYVCDGIYDCKDGRDEKNCDCLNNEFKCSGNFEKCIPSDWLCDGYADCPSGDDEHDSRCLKRGCAGNAIKCKSGKCVPEHLRCECEESTLARNCSKKSTDIVNKKLCKFGSCSQLCNEKKHHKESNYNCKCAEGYHMKNGICLVDDTHFLTMTAFRSDLSFFPTLDEALQEKQLSSHSYLISNLSKVTSFDFLFVNNETLSIFALNSFSSNALEKIDLNVNEYRNFNYTKMKSTFLIEPSKRVVLKSLSVDWITSKIYFIVDDLIKAMEMDGTKVRTIIDAGAKAWDIIVDPSNTRQIFWSTAMREIQVASMDGSHRRTFLKKDIEFVYGFAIDSPAKRLYWCDIKRSTIEAINLDGSGRQLVSKFKIHDKIYDLPINPIKLDVFEDRVYFTMTDNHLYTMNKFGSNNGTFTIVKHVNYTIRASHVKIIHAVRQQRVKSNPCTEHPCDKSAICYLSSTDASGKSCNCPDNNFIQKNGSYVECLEKAKNPSLCYKKCANDGKCKFNESQQMICECNPRFEGEFCEKYICSGYCKNRGSCILREHSDARSLSTSELKAQRKCICRGGWEGETCDVPKLECNQSTTCLNGGTCHATTSGGKTEEICSCPTNFSGSRCQNCAARQCFNGGSCTFSSDNYKCICPAGFAGLNCEIDKCRDYCFNNGKCSVQTTSNELKCECQFNFKGDRCEIDNRCENCGENKNNCTIHCHNGGKCIKVAENELCECFGEWKGIACNMLACVSNECGKCQENSPIQSCLCNDGSTQTCLPPEDSLYHQDVTATELPNENFKTLIVIIVAALVSVFVFVLIFATIIYVQRWQMRRFFNFSQLNENVEEITNPIFDLSGGGDDVGMPVTNVLSQGHFGNPLYDTMYATHSRKGLLEEKKSDDEDEFKSDLL